MQTLPTKKVKRQQITCRCPARDFPHRLDELKCKELYDSGSDETYQEIQRKELALFDRTEARAINASLAILRT